MPQIRAMVHTLLSNKESKFITVICCEFQYHAPDHCKEVDVFP